MLRSIIGGFVGAATVTLLHEYLKKYDGAPRLDKLGEEATAKTMETLGADVPKEDKLYKISLAGDILANTLYYSSAGANRSNPLLAGTGLGVIAGLGAVYTPGKLGLDTEPTAGSDSRKWITIALYTIGGLVAGAVIKRLSKSGNVTVSFAGLNIAFL